MWKSDVLANTEWILLPQISVVLFVAVFLFALYRVFRPGAAAYYEPFRSMPLDDQVPVNPINVTPSVKESPNG